MKKMAIRSLILLLFLSLACSKPKDGNIPNSPTISELLNSPSSIVLGNNVLNLEGYFYRDFMPPTQPNGSPLIAICRVIDSSGAALNDSIELTKFYMIYQNQLWKSDYTDLRWIEPNGIEGVARNGPKWGPDVFVDVVCEFRSKGTLYRLLAKEQEIEATY